MSILGRLLEPLQKLEFLVRKNILKPLAKNFLIPLGLTAAYQQQMELLIKNIFGSSLTKIIVSNKKMNDIMKILQYLEESGL